MTREIAPEVASSRTFRRWFELWWAEDYSIAGCEKKGIAIPKVYRRRRVTFAGREWYWSHCPPFDLNGEECPEFSTLPAVNFDGALQDQPYSSDMNADFRGAFVDDLTIPEISALRLKLDHAHVMSPIGVNVHSLFDIIGSRCYISGITQNRATSFSIKIVDSFCNGPVNLTGGPETRFICDSSKFSSPVRLSGRYSLIQMTKAVFKDAIDLSAAEKISRFSAQSASFSRRLEITKFQGIGDKIDLSRTKLLGGLLVSSVTSANGLDVSHSKAKGDLIVQSSNLSKLDLTNLTAGNVKITDFSSGQIMLNNARCGTVNIDRGSPAELQGDSLIVSGSLSIDRIQFAGRITLASARIGGKIYVRDCDIALGVHAKGLQVGSLASFRGTYFGQFSNFTDSIFEDGVDFGARTEFIGSIREPQADLGAVDFRSTSFKSQQRASAADFSGRAFRGKADFQHALFDGVAYFEREAFKEDVTFRLAKFSQPKPSIGSFRISRKFPFFDTVAVQSRQNDSEAAHLYERAFSNLKDFMKDAGSSRFEKKFHIYELRARRARSDSEVGFAERTFSYAYDIFSQYGESISRPLAWLLIIPFIFALIYLAIGLRFGLSDAWAATEFSLQQIFRPFFIWGQPVAVDVSKPEYDNWQYKYLLDADGSDWDPWGRSVFIKMIAVSESILALTLSFLLALSIKRRFQVQ